jgi:hypothetical protein
MHCPGRFDGADILQLRREVTNFRVDFRPAAPERCALLPSALRAARNLWHTAVKGYRTCNASPQVRREV